MNVRPKKFAPAAKANVPPKPPAQTFTFPAPTLGWVLNENLATPSPAGASILDNWICTTKSVRVRGGSQKWANLGGPVTSLMRYRNGANETLFGATINAIYDITTVADVEVTPPADVSGQASGLYSYEQFGTAGSDFLYVVNGADDAQLYDGTSWQAVNSGSSPISVTGATTSDWSHVWSYASRLFFVRKGTMTVDYLSVDSLGGAASQFSLAGVFKRGGSILFGATWSLDAGDGLDDKCVFVSTEGEVAVYQGTNPGTASDWAKVGVYDITDPIGQFGTMRAGGDLLIATRIGLVPVSEAVNKDAAALSLAAVSARIDPYWREQAETVTTSWEILKWPEKNIMVVSQPDYVGGAALVCNLQTGAWSRVTGWDTQCLETFEGRGFFGAADGYVYEMDVTGSDDGSVYTTVYLGQHEGLGVPGIEKTVNQMRPIFESASPISPLVTATTDFSQEVSAAPDAPADDGTEGWDIGVWDTAVWDAEAASAIFQRWRAVGRTGRTFAPELQLSFNSTAAPSVELVAIDATFDVGAVVT